MNRILSCVLTIVLAFASAAAGAEIDSIAWNQSNIERLQAMGKDAVFRFLLHQVDPDNEMEWTETSLNWDYKWYPAGNGKYELAIGYQSGPDVAYFTIFWRDAPGKIRSQELGGAGDASEEWYDGETAADLDGDGSEELIKFERLEYHSPRWRTKFIPNGTWPSVYRLRDGKYVEASRDFPSFYQKEILPKLDQAIVKTRKEIARVEEKIKPPARVDSNDHDYWLTQTRYLAALIMCRDKILRVIGTDPAAGLAQAREWMNSQDPVIVVDSRVVFEDIGGHPEDAHAAQVASERAETNSQSNSR